MAACDPGGLLAYPLDTVLAGGSELGDLLATIAEHEPIEVYVGLPTSLSGRAGPAALIARERAGATGRGDRVPVRLVDERLTTVTASQRLRASGKRAKQQRAVIDAASAVGHPGARAGARRFAGYAARGASIGTCKPRRPWGDLRENATLCPACSTPRSSPAPPKRSSTAARVASPSSLAASVLAFGALFVWDRAS